MRLDLQSDKSTEISRTANIAPGVPHSWIYSTINIVVPLLERFDTTVLTPCVFECSDELAFSIQPPKVSKLSLNLWSHYPTRYGPHVLDKACGEDNDICLELRAVLEHKSVRRIASGRASGFHLDLYVVFSGRVATNNRTLPTNP